MKDNVKYWVELPGYDLETAKAMLLSKRYLYVGFMAHQTIEKIFKAYFVRIKDETAPFTHNLSLLAQKSGIFCRLSEKQKAFIDVLEPLNIEARYPTYKQQLLASMTVKRCADILKNTTELHEWIKQRL